MILKLLEQQYQCTVGMVKDKVGEPGTEPYIIQATFTVTLAQQPDQDINRVLGKVGKTFHKYNEATFMAGNTPIEIAKAVTGSNKIYEFGHLMNEEGLMEFFFLKLIRVPGFLALTMESSDRPGLKRKWSQ